MKRHTRRRLLATVGAFGISGCLRLQEATGQGSSDGGDGDGDGDGTTTSDDGDDDADSTDDGTGDESGTGDDGDGGTDEAENDDYPPGLSEDGASALLADAHVNSLAGSTFTSTIITQNLTDGHVWGNETIEVGDGHILVTMRGGDPIVQYHDDGEILWRMTTGTREFYGRRQRTASHDELTFARRIRQHLLAGEWESPESNEDGGWHVSATGIDDGSVLAEEFEAATIESYEADADVTEDGIVTSIVADFQYVPRDDERLIRAENEIGATDVGETTVEQPSWVSEARERAPQITATVLEDRDCVEFVHEGGDPIPPNTDVGIHSQETESSSQAPLQREFDSGETLYASLADGETRLDRSGPPDGNVDPLEGRLLVWMDYNGAGFVHTELQTA